MLMASTAWRTNMFVCFFVHVSVLSLDQRYCWQCHWCIEDFNQLFSWDLVYYVWPFHLSKPCPVHTPNDLFRRVNNSRNLPLMFNFHLRLENLVDQANNLAFWSIVQFHTTKEFCTGQRYFLSVLSGSVSPFQVHPALLQWEVNCVG